ncbi:hypothetical protein [Hydrogenophaga sp. 2FB]|uniref:hypothetical protein n=1 Tax=Hydrogenophaga sp. 2FB TaxID=2502187 RepID=UPI0010F83F4F|nr:hypothetical protein [Hydrogenophaga sp. 2FB]
MKKQEARSRSLVTWVLVILLLVAFAALLIFLSRPALADTPNPLFVADGSARVAAHSGSSEGRIRWNRHAVSACSKPSQAHSLPM